MAWGGVKGGREGGGGVRVGCVREEEAGGALQMMQTASERSSGSARAFGSGAAASRLTAVTGLHGPFFQRAPTSHEGARPPVMSLTMSWMRSVRRVNGESRTSPAMERFCEA